MMETTQEHFLKDMIERNKAQWFVNHIQRHLDKGDIGSKAAHITPGLVGCTICGKDIEQIADETVKALVEISVLMQKRIKEQKS